MDHLGPVYAAGFAAVLLIAMNCSAPDSTAPVLNSYNGDVLLERNNVKVALSNELKIKSGDLIRVGDGQSSAEIRFITGAKLKCYVGTEFVAGMSTASSGSISLINGECFYLCAGDGLGSDSITISVKSLRISASKAVFSLYFNNETDEMISTVLLGDVKIFDGEKSIEVPACSRISRVGNEEIQMQAPSASELEGLKVWAGSSIIEKTLAKTGCTLQALSSVSMPPQILSTPGESAHPGELYKETITAQDPEGFPVHYHLASGPAGMEIDSSRGKIKYKPVGEKEEKVKILIIDRDSNIVTHEYTLQVTVKPSLYLSVPTAVKPGEPVNIIAKLKKSKSLKDKVEYRFDINGDGTFDVPAGGKFGSMASASKIIFSRDGINLVCAEARIGNDIIVKAQKRIVVNTPPAVVVKITPGFIRINENVTIDASGSTDPGENSGDLKMRFDLNGDGVWDIPSSSKFTNEQALVYRFDSPGKKKINVQVCDRLGACSIVSSEIYVGKGIAIRKIDCVDTAHVGDTISVNCIAENPEFPVTEYAWSVQGSQQLVIPEKKQRVNISFSKEGSYMLSCSITDEKKQCAISSKSVVIINSGASVDAGGPYAIAVNSPLTVKGHASDKDSRITKYSWDFDADGKSDTESVDASTAVWTFMNGGSKKITFTAYTEDGNSFSDDAVIEVTNTPPVADAGRDIISRSGRKVKLKGCAVDSEKNIDEYAWDFNADGIFDWKSSDTGYVEHEFEEYSVAVFKVTDKDSASSVDSVKVIVCPEGMETIENGHFCIDTYEWPDKKNSMPGLDVSYEEAVQLCKDAGKRLCTAQEWEMACRSDEKKWNYPYGKHYTVDKCNNLGNAYSKNKPAESGSFNECVGSAGVYDMSGNAAEWVLTDGGKPDVYGGSWQNGEERSMCNSKVQLERGKKYFYVGFRCCK
jgi:PKD repeat protein